MTKLSKFFRGVFHAANVEINDWLTTVPTVVTTAIAASTAPEAFVAAGTYPPTYGGGPIKAGHKFIITGAGAMGAVTVAVGDELTAKTNAPGQVDANWYVLEKNLVQATETEAGTAELATQAEVTTGTDDLRMVTPLKLATRAASETLSGLIELATQAETNTGTDDVRAVTPLKLATRLATESLAGIAEVATQGEVTTGTDDTRMVTPLKLAASQTTGAVDAGVIPVWTFLGATIPVTLDTLTIGADIYQFVTAAGSVNDDTYIGVPLGGSADATLDNLVAAINATAGVTGLKLIDGVTAALNHGTLGVKAVKVGTTVECRPAATPGGTALASNPSIALNEAVTDAGDIWNVGNVNVNTLGGRAAAQRKSGRATVTVTSAMITNKVQVDFGFTPTGFLPSARASDGGAVPMDGGDKFVITGNGILVTFGGGAGDLANTNVLTLIAWE